MARRFTRCLNQQHRNRQRRHFFHYPEWVFQFICSRGLKKGFYFSHRTKSLEGSSSHPVGQPSSAIRVQALSASVLHPLCGILIPVTGGFLYLIRVPGRNEKEEQRAKGSCQWSESPPFGLPYSQTPISNSCLCRVGQNWITKMPFTATHNRKAS